MHCYLCCISIRALCIPLARLPLDWRCSFDWPGTACFGLACVCCYADYRRAFPITGPRPLRLVCFGLLTGLFAMLVVMLAIWKLGDASVVLSGQSIFSAFRNGLSWLALDALGALGEELIGRAVILVLAERFVGVKGAVVVSGITFSWIHLSNPGASKIWLLRLFLQGILLAYAVFRTRSIWWSVGYHTGGTGSVHRYLGRLAADTWTKAIFSISYRMALHGSQVAPLVRKEVCLPSLQF